MSIKKVKKGLTLLEVVIAMAILVIIVSPVLSLTLSTTKVTKSADDKLEAMSIAQRYMENVKNSDTVDTLGKEEKTETFQKDGFEIIQTTIPMKQYPFKDIDKDSNNEKEETNTIEYEVMKINISESGSINSDNVDGVDLSKDLSDNTLNIQSNKDKDIKIKIDSNWDQILNLNVKNNVYDKNLEIYLFKDSNSKGDYSIKSSIGKVKIYSNVFNDVEESNSDYRLYKITIKVKKNGTELQNIEGYKTFLK